MSGPFLPVAIAILAFGTVAAVAMPITSLRELVGSIRSLTGSGNVWKWLAILFAVLNLKSLPFAWHYRFLRGLLLHMYFRPTPPPPSALFKPTILTMYNPLLECDYNIHKSNSTYFADMDISRTHTVATLLRQTATDLGKEEYLKTMAAQGKKVKSAPPLAIALGAVACSFKREVKPLESYEVWTRLLCWDRKWLYLVTYFVKKGTVKPVKYTLQPWKKGKRREEGNGSIDPPPNAVLATGISKYVLKRGRLTVPPEVALETAGLLPPRPAGLLKPQILPSDANTPVPGTPKEPSKIAMAPEAVGQALKGVAKKTEREAVEVDPEWTWEKMEAERQKGLKIAETFAKLDGLFETFDDGREGVLGHHGDIF